jgi:hypothetical protein
MLPTDMAFSVDPHGLKAQGERLAIKVQSRKRKKKDK